MNNYKILIDNCPVACALHKIIKNENEEIIDFEYLYVNPEFEKKTGFKNTEIEGQSFKKFFSQYISDDFNWVNSFKDILNNNQHNRLKTYFKPGKKHFNAKITRVEKDFFIVYFEDITKNEVAGNNHNIENINQKLEILESVFNYAPNIISIFDINGKYIKVSKKVSEFYNMPYDQIEGKYFSELLPQEVVDDFNNNIEQIKKTKKGFSKVDYLEDKNSSTGFSVFETILFPIQFEKGEVSLIGALAFDISGQKINQLKLESTKTNLEKIMNKAPVGVILVGKDKKIHWANEKALELTEFSLQRDLIGKNCKEYICAKEGEECPIFDKDEVFTDKECILKTRYNNEKPVLKTATAIKLNQQDFVLESFVDLSNQKLLNEQFKRNEELLEKTQKIGKIGGWEYDVLKDEMYWTNQVYLIHGFNPEEIKQGDKKHIEKSLTCYYPEDRKKILNAFKKCVANGEPYSFEVPITKINGEKIWVKTAAQAEYSDGKIIKVLGNFMDITSQVEAKISLKKANERFELAVQGANDGLWDWDLKNDKLYLSPKWKEILGYEDYELKNEFKTFENLIYKKDRKKVIEYAYKYLNGEISNYKIEFRMKHKDGSIRWIMAKGEALRDEDGIPSRLSGSHTDITDRKIFEEELKFNEKRFKDVVNAIGEVVFELDYKGCFTYISDKATDFFNKSPAGLIGESPLEFIYQDDRGIIINALEEAATRKGIVKNIEHRFKTKTGELRWASFSGMAIYDKKDSLIAYRGVLKDITKEKESRQNLIEAVEELKEANEQAEKLAVKAREANLAKSEFIANMSHEIRTPMNGIIGFTELLHETELNELQHEFVDTIQKSSNNLLDLINDILDFSKIEAGKLELEKTQVDLYELVENIVDIYKFKVKDKDIELLLNITPELPRFIESDLVRLNQILINLLSNSVKFTEKGEVELKVEKLGEDKSKNNIELLFSVRDTGIGIKSENFEKILKAFTQEDGSTTRKYGGTGLGLSICNKILKKMNSHMKIESEPGRGSTFSFIITVPVLKKDNGLKDLKINIKNVLIVDDNISNQKIILNMLQLKGINSDTASSGQEALKLLEKNKYEVLVIDYHMPNTNGLQLIQIIRENPDYNKNKKPVIFMHSSSDDSLLHKECHKLGVEFKLVKPVKIQKFYEILTKIHSKEEYYEKRKQVFKQNLINYASDKKLKVLIVEDDKINMKITQIFTRKLIPEADIAAAIDGNESVEKFQKFKPDIIIMDVQMPNLSGIKATEKIREFEKQNNLKQTPIIAITAGVLKGEKEKCLQSGMNEYISKPVKYVEFKEKVSKYLKNI
ncbi:MAG: PAS domain S-box protein [Candidatus Muiribacteriota bacterium]